MTKIQSSIVALSCHLLNLFIKCGHVLCKYNESVLSKIIWIKLTLYYSAVGAVQAEQHSTERFQAITIYYIKHKLACLWECLLKHPTSLHHFTSDKFKNDSKLSVLYWLLIFSGTIFRAGLAFRPSKTRVDFTNCETAITYRSMCHQLHAMWRNIAYAIGCMFSGAMMHALSVHARWRNILHVPSAAC